MACNKLGVSIPELYQIDFISFKNNNPELIPLNPKVQRLRYNHLNKLREKTINKLIEERREIIKSNITEHISGSPSKQMNKSNYQGILVYYITRSISI